MKLYRLLFFVSAVLLICLGQNHDAVGVPIAFISAGVGGFMVGHMSARWVRGDD